VGALSLFLAGFLLLVAGAQLLVKGAARLALRLGLPPLVVGLTVVAYGTSAPEAAVSWRAALLGQSDIALGNVVGSNILNVLLILGGSALITPLAVSRRLVRVDVPLLLALSLAVYAVALSGSIGRLSGLALLGLAGGYTWFTLRESRASDPPEVRRDLEAGAGEPSGPLAWNLALVTAGFATLVLGARWLVRASVELARSAGVSELVIALTIVALGTSLPEVATSFVAAARGQRDIAVGNVVGSNIFNLVVVLGGCAALSPGGIAVSPAALGFDLPLMLGVAAVSLPFLASGYRLDRREGTLLLLAYAAYTTYLVARPRS
jgi:cation:H+ antiporter